MIQPTLYIIIRRDIPDMNPGKACAQAAHAQADFDEAIDGLSDFAIIDAWSEWKQDRSFGRTLVLTATLDEMRQIVSEVEFSGITTDPTYPWKNYWSETFTSSEETAAWAFPTTSQEVEYLRLISLHNKYD